jgi:predicted HD superfamily hydrolase involved in NAD metabolism
MNMDDYSSFLARILTPPRYQHSLGVMQTMEELAGVYALDRAQAITTGLLHDAAKDLPQERLVDLAQEAGTEIRHPCEWHPTYLHGPVSAYLVSRELGVTDPAVLNAIAVHTFYGNGPAFDAPLSWCQRFADLLEPYRPWRGEQRRQVERVREVVYAGRMEEGALLHTACVVGWFEKDSTPVHPNMRRICRELAARLEHR